MDSPITNFYSRASREARLKGFIDGTWSQLFLLTRLSRGATKAAADANTAADNFYSRASREARH